MVWDEIQQGRVDSQSCSNLILIKVIVSGNMGERRRCGNCRREKPRRDFDSNARGRLQLTCRLCLVSYFIS